MANHHPLHASRCEPKVPTAKDSKEYQHGNIGTERSAMRPMLGEREWRRVLERRLLERRLLERRLLERRLLERRVLERRVLGL